MLYAPRVELCRFIPVNFFPPRPAELGKLRAICIGSKTRTIGDALMLSGLPAKLRAAYPNLRVTTYPRAFNPVVFHGNPAVSGLSYTPGSLYGDDCNEGSGHLIQLKERYFGVPVSSLPRPELHLLPGEREWAARYLAAHSHGSRPLLLVHPWGHTWTRVMTLERWSRFVARARERFNVWQLGMEGHERIPGCDHAFLMPKVFRHARRLFALMERARAFVGVNSGPMHAARAFGRPSLILTEQGDVERIFSLRREYPYFLHRNWANGFLYEEDEHLDVSRASEQEATRRLEDFISRQ